MTTRPGTSQRPPTGEQVTISHGRFAAVTVAVAAGLRRLTVDGRELVDGHAEDERPSGGRGQTLVPWPNRVAAGRYRFDDVELQLPLTEPADGNAIHGLARWTEWGVGERSQDSVTWRCLVVPQPGWPTSLEVSVTYSLDDAGLQVTTTARNVGSAPCPYGSGAHPYLSAGTATVDTCTLQVPGHRWYATDGRGIPTGSEPVDGTEYDLRAPRAIGNRVLDTAYSDLDRDDDGRWRVRLQAADGGVTLWGDETYDWLQVFTGDTLAEGQRRRGLAVEPMTCPPNAFNTGEGLVRLEPGDEHTGRWGISPS